MRTEGLGYTTETLWAKAMGRCRTKAAKQVFDLDVTIRATEFDCRSNQKRKKKKKDIIVCAWLWCIAKGARGMGSVWSLLQSATGVWLLIWDLVFVLRFETIVAYSLAFSF